MPDKNPEDLMVATPDISQVEEGEPKPQDATTSSLDWADSGDVLEVAGDILLGGAVDAAKDVAEGAVEVVASVISGIFDS